MTCKDCIYYDMCWQRIEIDNGNFMLGSIGNCNKFKEKSRFVELPCKVGDTVWILYTEDETIESKEISAITIDQNHDVITFTNMSCFTIWSKDYGEYFGKTVFLTKEEAEAKLRELQNE